MRFDAQQQQVGPDLAARAAAAYAAQAQQTSRLRNDVGGPPIYVVTALGPTNGPGLVVPCPLADRGGHRWDVPDRRGPVT